MYGMINQAVEQMVTELHGEAMWERIRRRANCDVEHFVRMDAYPDEVTFGLVGAASAELQVPASELLMAFGKFWIAFAQRAGYGELFRVSSGYAAFLMQLDAMHTRLQLSFPQLRMPQFSCVRETDDLVRVIYRSHRVGLTPFVVGLLEGLGPVFQVVARVELVQSKPSSEAGAEDHFRVTLERG